MGNIEKIIKKRRKDNRGYVIYRYCEEKILYSSTSMAKINKLYEEIKKDFPNIEQEKIEVRIRDDVDSMTCLEMVFYTFNLPKKSEKFKEIDSYKNNGN